MALQHVTVEEQCPTVAEILASPIANYITCAATNGGYIGTEEELIFNQVRTLRGK